MQHDSLLLDPEACEFAYHIHVSHLLHSVFHCTAALFHMKRTYASSYHFDDAFLVFASKTDWFVHDAE